MGNSVRAAPSSPVPAGPASLQLPPCAPGLLTPGRPEGPGSGSPPGSGRGSRDSVGGSSRAAVKGGGRRGLRAACARREQGGSGGVLGRGVGGRPCPRAARRGRARLQLLSALPPGSSLGSCKVWWSPAPPGGPRPQSHRPLPRPTSGFHPRGSAVAALPVAGSSHHYSRRRTLSFHPLFLTIHLSFCLFGPSPLWPLLSPLYLALSLLNSLSHARFRLFFSFFPTPPSFCPSLSTQSPRFHHPST